MTMAAAPPLRIDRAFEEGAKLAFIIGAFRGGTTVLRKLLDSHPRLYSPAETWFMLPLLNLWDGRGTCEQFVPSQAAAAIRNHLQPPQFLDCCRAFAARFYASNMPVDAAYFIDKTPLYLHIAQALPVIFPRAKFLVLSRDPRGICWSRHTWRHLNSASPESQFAGVAADVQRMSEFLRKHATRSLHVSYERLCLDPQSELHAICQFLGVDFNPAMIDYGAQAHHEGYGDENSRNYSRPHTESVSRWESASGLSAQQQQRLLELCGEDALEVLGFGAGALSEATSEVCRR